MSGGTPEAPATVLEVGCGMGVLTQFLLQRDDVVTYGAEIDTESVEYLHEHYPDFAPRLIEGDFLKMNLRERFGNEVRVIGNFPYNISSQIFFKVKLLQMIKRIVPPISNEVITLVKDTSLAFAISYSEMFTMAKKIASSQSTLLPFAIAGLFYYIFNFAVAYLMERGEKRLSYYR